MPRGPKRTTSLFHVKAIKDDELLGFVSWQAGWRQYVFHPIENTYYSSGCLSQIASFISNAMQKRKRDLK